MMEEAATSFNPFVPLKNKNMNQRKSKIGKSSPFTKPKVEIPQQEKRNKGQKK